MRKTAEYLDKVCLEPVVVLDSIEHLLLLTTDCHRRVSHVRKLRGRMVSPDDYVLHVLR